MYFEIAFIVIVFLVIAITIVRFYLLKKLNYIKGKNRKTNYLDLHDSFYEMFFRPKRIDENATQEIKKILAQMNSLYYFCIGMIILAGVIFLAFIYKLP